MEPKYYAVKNWGKFQSHHDHEKTGRVIQWIKFYPALLDDVEFSEMPEAARLLWPHLLLISVKNGGRLPNNTRWIQKQLNMKGKIPLETYINAGFLIPIVCESVDNSTQIRLEESREDKNRLDSCTDVAKATSLPDDENASHGSTRSKIEYSYESGSLTGVGADDIAEWERAYPAVDIRRNIAAAAVWLGANPQKRKKNIRRFLVGWFSRSQEKGGDLPRSNSHGGTAKNPSGLTPLGGIYETQKPEVMDLDNLKHIG